MFFLLHFLSVRLISLPFTSPWCWLGVSLVGLFLLLFLHWSLGLLIPFFAFPFVQQRPSPVIFSYFPKGLLTPTVLRSLPLRLVLFTGQLLGGLSFFNLDGQVIDLNWKIAHGVLYTAGRLSSFRLSVPLPCFCGAPVETLSLLSFACPLAQSVLAWVQSLMFSFDPMSPVLLVRHSLFGLDPAEVRSTPRIFV